MEKLYTPANSLPEPSQEKNLENMANNPERITVEPKNTPEIPPEMQKQAFENDIRTKETNISKDETRIKEVRESLGLAPESGNAPAIEAEKKKLDEMQEKLETQNSTPHPKEVTEKPPVSQEKTDGQRPDASRDSVKSREIKNNNQEITTSFNRLSSALDELQKNIRGNGFNPVSFHGEDFRNLVNENGFNIRKATDVIESLSTSLRRELLPEGKDRLALETHNFTRVMDSFEDTTKVLYRLKNTFKNLPPNNDREADRGIQDLGRQCGLVIARIRQQTEHLTESRRMLDRLKSRW